MAQAVSPSRIFVVWVIFWLPVSVYGQGADNPDRLQVRAGYFATPLELAGDKHKRKITSILIDCENLDERDAKGYVTIDSSLLEFNYFGDATPVDEKPTQEYEVSLTRIVEPARLMEKRKLFKIEFAEEFCDRILFLNIPQDTSQAAKLLVCPKYRPSERRRDYGPTIERMIPLVNTGPSESHPMEEPVANDVILSTGYLNLFGDTTGGIEFYLKPGETGSIQNNMNRTLIQDYGDGAMQTTAAVNNKPARFLDKKITDPLKLGRRVFELEGQLPRRRAESESSNVTETCYLVVGPKSPGNHRMVFKQNKVVRIVPLRDIGWERHLTWFARITDAIAADAVRQLRKFSGNQFKYVVNEQGDVYSAELENEISNQTMALLFKFPRLRRLKLTRYQASSQPIHLESIDQLPDLEFVLLQSMQVSDPVMESLGRLTNLSTLIIHNKETASSQRLITDNGVRSLAGLQKLKRLDISGKQISDGCLSDLQHLEQLQSLSMFNTSVTISGAASVAMALPDCRIYLNNYGGGSNRVSFSLSKDRKNLVFSGTAKQADYENIAKLERTQAIRIPANATDENIQPISTMKSLRSISIRNNHNVTNETVKHLSSLPELQRLELAGCSKLDSGCLENITSMSILAHLSLPRKGISNEAVKELKNKMPDCQIHQH